MLGGDADSDLGPVTFLLHHAQEVSHGRTALSFLTMLKKTFSCLTFLCVVARGGSGQSFLTVC